MSPKTTIAFQEIFLRHETGNFHPENPGRLAALVEHLDGKLPQSLRWEKDFPSADLSEIAKVHTLDYIEGTKKLCETKKIGFLDGDTPFSAESYSAASKASGAGIFLASEILNNKTKSGFALVRPPGHHAEEDHAMGFCLFNHIAVTARYLQSRGMERICILDWDVHHGNGTQNQFYSDPGVYFVSLHQFPFYPGTGSDSEVGEGAGLGTTKNFPLSRGSTELDYNRCFSLFEKEMDFFQPEIYLISAGFDAHKEDPLGGMQLTSSSFANFTRRVKDLAESHAQGRILSFLEGGYDYKALCDSVYAHLEVLSG